MKSEESPNSPHTNGHLNEILNDKISSCFQEIFDWSSTYEANDESRYFLLSEQSIKSLVKFKPISPIIFKKASRKWLNQNSQNFYSQAKNILPLSKDQISAGKALQSFENYLSIVSLMYFGDPYSKNKQASEVFRPGKRTRKTQLADPLSMIVSPLRNEFEFGKILFRVLES